MIEISQPPEVLAKTRAELERSSMQSGMTSLAGYQAGETVSQNHAKNELIIISGQSGAGNSTWCQAAVAQARAAGLMVAGLISPAIFENGLKVGIDLIDIKTGERRLLAIRKQEEQDSTSCKWDFNESTCTWANQVLRSTTSTELVFIDELGPLELRRGQGFKEGLRLLDTGRFETAFVVVRPSLLSITRQRWPHMQLFHLKARTP